MPRKKSSLWKWTLWSLVAILSAEVIWLATVPIFRETLKQERATPRVQWLNWPSEIDLQTHVPFASQQLSYGPFLTEPRVLSRSGGSRIASLSLESKICWPELPGIIEPWNIRMEMAVVLIENERFLATARGTMRPDYTSKKLNWKNLEKCEPVIINSDFVLPSGSKFYGYILRVFYKERMTFIASDPPTLREIFPFSNERK